MRPRGRAITCTRALALLSAIDRPVAPLSTCGGQAIPDGSPTSLTIPAGGVATFTFEGSACRKVSASITASTVGNCSLIYHKLRIYNPERQHPRLVQWRVRWGHRGPGGAADERHLHGARGPVRAVLGDRYRQSPRCRRRDRSHHVRAGGECHSRHARTAWSLDVHGHRQSMGQRRRSYLEFPDLRNLQLVCDPQAGWFDVGVIQLEYLWRLDHRPLPLADDGHLCPDRRSVQEWHGPGCRERVRRGGRDRPDQPGWIAHDRGVEHPRTAGSVDVQWHGESKGQPGFRGVNGAAMLHLQLVWGFSSRTARNCRLNGICAPERSSGR